MCKRTRRAYVGNMRALRAFHLEYLSWTLETHMHKSVRRAHAICDTIMLLAVIGLLTLLPAPFGIAAAAGLIALIFAFYCSFDFATSCIVTVEGALGLWGATRLDALLSTPQALALYGTVFVISVSCALLSHVLVKEKVRLYPDSNTGVRRIAAFALYGTFLPFFGAQYQTTLWLLDIGCHEALASQVRNRVGTGLAPLL
jgi:hypothetical protein